MKKHLKLIGINVVVILAILATTGGVFLKVNADNRLKVSHQMAYERFSVTHGDAKMLSFKNPKEFYAATWETDTHIGMSLYVDGVWVTVIKQPKKTQTNTEINPEPAP